MIQFLMQSRKVRESGAWLEAGQSNMDGRNEQGEANTPQWLIDGGYIVPEYQMFNDIDTFSNWRCVNPFNSGNQTFTDRWGAGVVAMRNLAVLTGKTQYGVKGTYGGTGFKKSTTIADWTTDPQWYIDNPSVINLGERLITRLNAAKTSFLDANNIPLKGVLWHQGEQNAGDTQSFYETEFGNLIDYIRTQTGISNLPFIIGTVGVTSTGYDANIDTAIRNIVNIKSNIYLCDLSNATYQDDGIHHDALATVDFADKILNYARLF